jgi:hypothetical protein
LIQRLAGCFLFFTFSLLSSRAWSYPNYISYGYQSCLSCHFNPYGNGPLTDYGRAVGATAISDRLNYSASASEEEIANSADFFGGHFKPSKTYSNIRPSASYRGLYLQRNINKKDDAESEFITMDAGIALAMTFLDNKMIVVGQGGYAPVPLSVRGSGAEDEVKEYRSREHYVGYRFDKELGIYAGLMDKVYGIRVPDHTAYSRSLTSNNQNDQVHGVLAHYAVDPIEFGVHLFVGNLVQDSDLRQRGVSGQAEYSLGKFSRVGVSMMSSVSDYRDVNATALQYRTGFGKGNSLMLELGRTKNQVQGQDVKVGHYLFLQNHYNFRRGLFGIMTVEGSQPDREDPDHKVRFGPGVQWFPMQRVELRADIYNTKSYGTGSVSDTWYMASQIHLWF